MSKATAIRRKCLLGNRYEGCKYQDDCDQAIQCGKCQLVEQKAKPKPDKYVQAELFEES